MAAGTIASRATGFLRVLALGYALGFNRLSDAYNLANTLPNIVYELILGGVVERDARPDLRRHLRRRRRRGRLARRRRGDLARPRGHRGAERVVLRRRTAALPRPTPRSTTPPQADAQHNLTVAFMRYFAPQVVLLAGMAVGSAILNARRKFAAPMFAPVLNNVVTIGALFAAPHFISKGGERSLHLGAGLVVLGLGTTLGYAAQLAGLIPSFRAIGARLKPVWDPQHPAVRHAARAFGLDLRFRRSRTRSPT